MGLTSSREWVRDEWILLSRTYNAIHCETEWIIERLNDLSEYLSPREAAEQALGILKWRLHILQNSDAYAEWDCNEDNLRWMTQEILLVDDDWEEGDDFDGISELFEIVIDRHISATVQVAELEFQNVDVNAPSSISIRDGEEKEDSDQHSAEEGEGEMELPTTPRFGKDIGIRHRNLMTEQV
jgi:hypothetical protein